MDLLKPNLQSTKAFAPASVSNLAVGFDILGFAFAGLGDTVTLSKREDNQLLIEMIDSKTALPFENTQNTATVALEAFRQHLHLKQGFNLHIQKGIPLCSGLGGSAASAIATLVAANAFLKEPLSRETLIECALESETLASGQGHADNIVPCLFGGLTLIKNLKPLEVIQLPEPALYSVLLHPALEIKTKEARQLLKSTISLSAYVKQSAVLASFIAALYQSDLSLLKTSFLDLLIEPQRAPLIPGFYKLKEAALKADALGFCISGSGPTLLALAADQVSGQKIAMILQETLRQENISSQYWLAPFRSPGAFLL